MKENKKEKGGPMKMIGENKEGEIVFCTNCKNFAGWGKLCKKGVYYPNYPSGMRSACPFYRKSLMNKGETPARRVGRCKMKEKVKNEKISVLVFEEMSRRISDSFDYILTTIELGFKAKSDKQDIVKAWNKYHKDKCLPSSYE